MKKTILVAIIAASCILTGCAYTDYLRNYVFTATGGAVSGSFVTTEPTNSSNNGQNSGSSIHVSSDAVSGSGIVTAKDVTADMQKDSYWIDRQIAPDKLMLSSEEISQWNEKYGTLSEEKSSSESPFLVVTGKNLSVGKNIYGMGDKIALLTDAEKDKWIQEHGKEDCMNTYLANIPLSFMGKSTNIPTAIPASEEVQIGYPDYTKTNIIRQAFRYLGSLHLTEEEEEADKKTEYVKRVYSSFGISLPGKKEEYIKMKDKTIDVSKLSAKEKIEKLNSIEPGTLLDFSGNICIYLGCVEQKHYAIGYFAYTCSIREITQDSPKNQPDEHTWLTDLTNIYKIY